MSKGLKFEQNNSQVNNTTVLNHVGERRCQFRTSEQADAIQLHEINVGLLIMIKKKYLRHQFAHG